MGKLFDERTDLWAFGCVLLQNAHRPFAVRWKYQSIDTLARVLEREPDWSALPATTSPSSRRLLLRCLAKIRKTRLRDIGDARLDVDRLVLQVALANHRASNTRREYFGLVCRRGLDRCRRPATWLGRTGGDRDTCDDRPDNAAPGGRSGAGDTQHRTYPIALSRDE